MAPRRRATRRNIFGLGEKPKPKRRTTRRKPSVSRRVGGFLWREVTGQRKREAAEKRQKAERAAAAELSKVRRQIDRDMRDRERDAHQRRLQQLRETKEMRAAAVLWHRAEAEKAKAELYRARAEAARKSETRRSNSGKAETAERKQREFEEMTRLAEQGKLSPEQIRYYVNTYGRGVRKVGT